MAGDAKTRASDEDRDRTAAALREHLVAGRLTIEEFDERLDQAYAAKTLGELDSLMADLPQIDLLQVPDASLRRPVRAGPGQSPAVRRAAWRSWLAVGLCVLVIWLISGTSGAPWLLWVILPLGAVLLARRIR